jgi:hypothetical protein
VFAIPASSERTTSALVATVDKDCIGDLNRHELKRTKLREGDARIKMELTTLVPKRKEAVVLRKNRSTTGQKGYLQENVIYLRIWSSFENRHTVRKVKSFALICKNSGLN